ncbi:alpha/beta hydrolase [Arcticibacterium luteifluviistationis]|uniref:Lipase n=1 Tax=Arcticibacterium luteifluviistationis TaxID=1784714 RepID=A0A2Z4GCM5_9BACT|nr:alpha/beta hydrolase [Arcticibacterium luteifluviistationis]AWV98818.1 lipase [Arcticibacterium luteifluviistationis]
MKRYFLALLFSSFIIQGFAQKYTNITYGLAPERELKMDIYMPKGIDKPVLVVWVHGGAWHSGSKENPPLGLLKRGYALASIDYRLSTEARFPAMLFDIKAAIRFLRGNAEKYDYQREKIIIWGSSAGGHLVALTGLTNGNENLEGNIGDYLNESSDVNLTLDFFGPTNFKTILAQSTPHGVGVRAPALATMFGMPVEMAPEMAELASPVFHVDATDPPLFIAHGNQDNQVPINQSIELWLKLKEAGVPTEFEILGNMGHGGADFSSKEFMDKVVSFIEENL